MFYVIIFQLFLTFVSYKYGLVTQKRGYLLYGSKVVLNCVRSDVVTQYIQVKCILTLHLLVT